MWYLAGKRKEAKLPLPNCSNFHFSTPGYCNSIFSNSVWVWFCFSTKLYARDLTASHQLIHVYWATKNRISWGKWELNPQFECLKLIQSSGSALLPLQTQIYSTAVIFTEIISSIFISRCLLWQVYTTAICSWQPPNLKKNQSFGSAWHDFPTVSMIFPQKLFS